MIMVASFSDWHGHIVAVLLDGDYRMTLGIAVRLALQGHSEPAVQCRGCGGVLNSKGHGPRPRNIVAASDHSPPDTFRPRELLG